MVANDSSLPRVLLLGGSHSLEEAFPEDILAALSPWAQVLNHRVTGPDWREDRELLAQADYLLSTWGVPRLDADFLAAAPRLKGLFYAAGAVKGFVTPEFFARGILLSSAVKANAIPVMEYAVATIILSLKNVWRHSREIRRTREWKRLKMQGAYRSKVGLVSLGAVGRLTAEKLGGYDLEVLAYDPFATPESAAALGVRLLPLEDLFAQSDVVSLHTPWLPETENLVGESLLRSMKSGATILNTSRGAVIDEAALCRVLAERQDLTAVLDVTDPEPPASDSPLFDLDNVFLTPHIAGSMMGEVARMGSWMVEELLRHIQGQPLQHVVTEDMLKRAA